MPKVPAAPTTAGASPTPATPPASGAATAAASGKPSLLSQAQKLYGPRHTTSPADVVAGRNQNLVARARRGPKLTHEGWWNQYGNTGGVAELYAATKKAPPPPPPVPAADVRPAYQTESVGTNTTTPATLRPRDTTTRPAAGLPSYNGRRESGANLVTVNPAVASQRPKQSPEVSRIGNVPNPPSLPASPPPQAAEAKIPLPATTEKPPPADVRPEIPATAAARTAIPGLQPRQPHTSRTTTPALAASRIAQRPQSLPTSIANVPVARPTTKPTFTDTATIPTRNTAAAPEAVGVTSPPAWQIPRVSRINSQPGLPGDYLTAFSQGDYKLREGTNAGGFPLGHPTRGEERTRALIALREQALGAPEGFIGPTHAGPAPDPEAKKQWHQYSTLAGETHPDFINEYMKTPMYEENEAAGIPWYAAPYMVKEIDDADPKYRAAFKKRKEDYDRALQLFEKTNSHAVIPVTEHPMLNLPNTANMTREAAGDLLIQRAKQAAAREKQAITGAELLALAKKYPAATAALLGGGVGAGAGLLSASNSDEEKKPWLSNMLTGGALGAGLGGLGMLGYNSLGALTGKSKEQATAEAGAARLRDAAGTSAAAHRGEQGLSAAPRPSTPEGWAEYLGGVSKQRERAVKQELQRLEAAGVDPATAKEMAGLPLEPGASAVPTPTARGTAEEAAKYLGNNLGTASAGAATGYGLGAARDASRRNFVSAPELQNYVLKNKTDAADLLGGGRRGQLGASQITAARPANQYGGLRPSQKFIRAPQQVGGGKGSTLNIPRHEMRNLSNAARQARPTQPKRFGGRLGGTMLGAFLGPVLADNAPPMIEQVRNNLPSISQFGNNLPPLDLQPPSPVPLPNPPPGNAYPPLSSEPANAVPDLPNLQGLT